MSYKLDLHTHSYGSPDGGLVLRDYRYFLQNMLLDHVAITDHDSVEAALQIRKQLGDLGDRIIIGQEITTTAGEIIGLYLTSTIASGLTPSAAVAEIRRQGGLVYIPHPFETVRSGLSAVQLESIAQDVDIVEIYNGRAVFQNKGLQAQAWATRQGKPAAASSDAHGRFGWGRSYSVISEVPTRENLSEQLRAARYNTQTVGSGILYPKLNRLRKRLVRGTA